MRQRKTIHWEKGASALQKTFVRKVNALMEKNQLSDNELARRLFPDKPSRIQRSVSRITSCTQDPSLEKVQQFADALGVSPLQLLVDDAPQKISVLSGYPEPFSEETKLRTKSRSAKRKRV